MRLVPLERDIQAAIIQVFRLRHRLILTITNAGGADRVKGVLPGIPAWMAKALQLPQDLPFGLQTCLRIPPTFSDLAGSENDSQRWVFIEVKKPGGRFRPGQREFLAARRAEGHIAFWADSVDSALAQYEQQSRERVA